MSTVSEALFVLLVACVVSVASVANGEEPFRLIVVPVGPENPRNSEADIIQLKDGSLLLGWTQFYAGSGALFGLGVYLAFTPFDPVAMTFAGIDRRELEIMTGAGIVAGLVYWAVAGREAGRWRE